VDRRHKTLIAEMAAQIVSGTTVCGTSIDEPHREQMVQEAVELAVAIFNAVEKL
jgi:hypothetical protein